METLQEHIGTLRGNGQIAGCRKRGKAKTAIRTNQPSADGFLNHQFLPLWEGSKADLPEKDVTESGFFKSLFILSHRENFKPMELAAKPYPYNVLLAYWDVIEQMDLRSRDTELLLLQTGDEEVGLASEQTYYTGSTLFYIPVIPLYKLLQYKKYRRCGRLLLCVFAYLYHTAKVPYYRNQETYLYWQYEMNMDWIRDDIDGFDIEDYNHTISELNKAAHIGDVMERKIYGAWHLENFETLLRKFKPNDEFGTECFKVATTAFELMNEFPNHTIYSNLQPCKEEDETIMCNQYISFIAEDRGSLYNQIIQTINEDFGNKGDMQLPTAYTFYSDDNPIEAKLEFEEKLFPMITDLCTLLNEIR